MGSEAVSRSKVVERWMGGATAPVWSVRRPACTTLVSNLMPNNVAERCPCNFRGQNPSNPHSYRIYNEGNMTEKATFGAGCFWGVEQGFREIPGVLDAVSGYLGGKLDNPTYHDVCTDTTGHAEVVEVTFDPARVSYDQLLDAFCKMHNPTTLNRQGPDT